MKRKERAAFPVTESGDSVEHCFTPLSRGAGPESRTAKSRVPSPSVSWILLTNDDGIESPALFPFADALSRIGEVRIVVPDAERSWSSKAITRYGDIHVTPADRNGITALAVSGYPADAVQVGAHFFDTKPRLVISGINIGYNHGAGYILASGTVGAAIEGWELGIKSITFSAGSGGVWSEWRKFAGSNEAIPIWVRLSALCAELLEELLATDLAGDVINVNVPWDAGDETPRRVTSIARVAYGPVYQRVDDTTFRHRYRQDFTVHESLEGTDVGVNELGQIAITPMMMPQAPEVADEVRKALER